MKIAIVGASSQIAKDLIVSFISQEQINLLLYVRDITAAAHWLKKNVADKKNCTVHHYTEYGKEPHEVVINFIGVGNPQRAAEMGAAIFDVTLQYDDMILRSLVNNPDRKYIFLSSGAAYGDVFNMPVDEKALARIDINNIVPQHYYAVAKLHAEVRHRSFTDFAITDVRVFNYFSRTQDLNARFFITDIIRAIRDRRVLKTSADFMVRDFVHPSDFSSLISCVIHSQCINCAIDCYSIKPIEKTDLLQKMQDRFGLTYEVSITSENVSPNATNAKAHYYSCNRKAEEFGYEPKLTSWEGIEMEVEALRLAGKLDINPGESYVDLYKS